MTRVPPMRRPDKDFEAIRRLTPRDRFLLDLLAEHYLLSTRQIARVLFDSLRSAQQRLTILHRLEVLDRYAEGAPSGGMETPYLYGLGRIGLQQRPTVYNDLDRAGGKPPRSSRERLLRLTRGPGRDHLLGVNQFFVDLHHHARTHPGIGLLRWWSEQHATEVFNTVLTNGQPYAKGGVHPDGHGVWIAAGREVGFFAEHDRGIEFSGGYGPCRSPDLRVSAAHWLMVEGYRPRQVWCKHSSGVTGSRRERWSRHRLQRTSRAPLQFLEAWLLSGRRGSSDGWWRCSVTRRLLSCKGFGSASGLLSVSRWAWGRYGCPRRDRHPDRLPSVGWTAAYGRFGYRAALLRKTFRGLSSGGGNHAYQR